MITHNFFNDVFVIPILNVLFAFHKIFEVLNVPGTLGFAIILLTVVIRFLLHPFFKQQMHTQRKMQEMKPHMDRLHALHKKDPKKLQQEQMKLYQEHGINPASGCLFLIIQIPVFIGLYSALNAILANGVGEKVVANINSLLYTSAIRITQPIDTNFLGFNLALSPQNAGGQWFYYLIPLITGYLQYLQAKVTTQTPPTKAIEKKSKDDKDKKTDIGGDFQKAMNTQMKYIFPVMIAYFAYTLPVGLSLYWNIFSLFSILQYRRTHELI